MYIVRYWQKKSGGNGLLFVKTILVFFRNSSSTFVVPFCPIGCILVFRPGALCHCPSMSGSALKDIWIIISIWRERLKNTKSKTFAINGRSRTRPLMAVFPQLFFDPILFFCNSILYIIFWPLFLCCVSLREILDLKREKEERGRKRREIFGEQILDLWYIRAIDPPPRGTFDAFWQWARNT